ncbi:MAG: anthranilate synthase component I family protein, partial [Cyclonatronaceae bacterium]
MKTTHFLSKKAFSRLIMELQERDTLLQLESQHVGETLLGAGAAASLSCYGNTAYYEENGGITSIKNQSAWDALHDFREQQAGKWVFGLLGYDLKNSLEALASENPDAVGAPNLAFFAPVWVMRYRAQTGRLDIVAAERPFPERLLSQAEEQAVREPEPAFLFELATGDIDEKRWYTGIIEQAKRDIYEGQYYEINLSRELKGRYSGPPYALYERMKAVGPVPFGAYFRFQPPRSDAPLQVCCASPERFLRRSGLVLQSQPIKGTAAVSATGDAAENKRIAAELLQSEKNRAENLMIVDLVRHDFNQICVPGSVKVPELFGIHRFPTVFQMLSTVEGRLREGVDPVQALQRCFPMGSMTGAPKIRSMQRIEALEKRRRGIYSGSLGYISPEGEMDFNVVIRSALCKSGALVYNVGG